MIVVCRRRKNEIDREWHFHTQCPRWPEKDFEQRRYLEAREGERLCGECARLESEMSLQKSRIEYDQLARDIQRADQYIKERVKEGMSELEAEDRAVELILAPSDGPTDFYFGTLCP